MSGVPHSTEPVPGASVDVFRSASPELASAGATLHSPVHDDPASV
ncbi:MULTISPECIES: hypothetical protein [Pseudomonas]|nr:MULTISPECIES: hypothetical protein [Pseudomonas]